MHRAINFPARLWHEAKLQAIMDPAVRAKVEAWTATLPMPWLVFSGPPGTGKTFAAAAAARVLIEAGRQSLFTTSTRVLDRIRATFDSDRESQAEAEYLPRRVSVLLLDDLGAEKASDWAAERLLSILDDRWSDGRLTIITTNVHPSQAEDSRQWSRVFGTRFSRVILTSGPDRRRA